MEWTNLIGETFWGLWDSMLSLIPGVLAAIVTILLGWAISVALGNVITKIVVALKLNSLCDKIGLTESFNKIDIKFNFAALLGWLAKWFLIIVFFTSAADMLELSTISAFLYEVLGYIPQVFVAAIILVVGFVVANFVRNLIHKAVSASSMHTADFAAGTAKWAIVVFTFLAALEQLGVAPRIIQTFFTGFVAMLAIAGGLAFGLGGQDWAKKMLSRMREDIGS